jgi:exosortase/archaeosortase family protein
MAPTKPAYIFMPTNGNLLAQGKRLFQKIVLWLRRYHLDSLKGVILFSLITISIHYGFIYWAGMRYGFLRGVFEPLEEFLTQQVFYQSQWLVANAFSIETYTIGKVLFFTNHTHITINIGCSGFKQMLHFALLFMIYPGPWQKKLWFIPLGIGIMHLINVGRIVGLSVLLQTQAAYFNAVHDNFFRPLFYVLIFGMWIWWTERLAKPKQSNDSGILTETGVKP